MGRASMSGGGGWVGAQDFGVWACFDAGNDEFFAEREDVAVAPG